MSAPFKPTNDGEYTVVHMFAGSGGCSSGFELDGFVTVAAIDNDDDACADLDYLLNKQVAVCANVMTMEPADLRRIVGSRRPDVFVSTPPCKGWSRLLDKRKRKSEKYVQMCSLAVRSVWLAMYAWDEPPPLILIENVRGMATEGREMMQIIKSELSKFGYLFDIRVHNVGKLGNLAQSRDRCMFVARDPKRCPAFLMVPEEHPLRPCGEELGKLPPPVMDARSDSMHRLPQLSALNWLRIAAIRAGKDWKDLPARIRLGGDPKDRMSKYGVERWDEPAHTVVGAGARVPSGRCAVADQNAAAAWSVDPQIRPGGETTPRNGNYGVEAPTAPAHTIRGEHQVWSAPASYADPRYQLGPNAHAGILGVEHPDAPAHTVTGNARVQGSWGGIADRRLGANPGGVEEKPKKRRNVAKGQADLFSGGAEPGPAVNAVDPRMPSIDPRVDDHAGNRQNGGFGVNAWEGPAHTVVAEGSVQNTWTSAAAPLPNRGPRRPGWARGRRNDSVDPRLHCKQWSGSYGVLHPDEPAATVLAHMRHDNSAASCVDTKLGYRAEGDEAAGKHSGRGCYGVVDPAAPALTIRGHMEVRQAPGAVAAPLPTVDPRKEWAMDGPPGSWSGAGRLHNYGVQEWDRPSGTIRGVHTLQNARAAVAHPDYPVPTHRLVRDVDGELVLLGPPIEDWNAICYLVIQSEDGSWHRPMTDLELAVLQSLPAEHNGKMLALRGPSGKRREHIGNMLPRMAAYQMARSCRATLDQKHGAFMLVGCGKIWVEREERLSA